MPDRRKSDRRVRLIRRFAAASLAGQFVFLVTVLTAGWLEPGYSEIRDAVSYLGARNAAHPWTFDIGVAIWGASFIAAAAAPWLDSPCTLRGRLGPSLIAFTGVAQILDGFPFPLDCRRTIDAGCRAQELASDVSWQHVAHGWAYFDGAIALQLSVFAIAWRFRGNRHWGRSDLLAAGAALIAVAIVVGLFWGAEFSPHGNYGLVQRLSLAAGGIWVGALCVGLLGIYGQGGEPVARFLARLRSLPGGRLLPVPASALG